MNPNRHDIGVGAAPIIAHGTINLPKRRAYASNLDPGKMYWWVRMLRSGRPKKALAPQTLPREIFQNGTVTCSQLVRTWALWQA